MISYASTDDYEPSTYLKENFQTYSESLIGTYDGLAEIKDKAGEIDIRYRQYKYDSSDYSELVAKGFIWPCACHTITSYFGNRTSPTAGASSNHRGIDIGASTGTAVYASASGTVIETEYSSARGYYVTIDHGNNMYTRYQHLQTYYVSVGDKVKQGETIALSGNSGVGTGPHLHFEVHKGYPQYTVTEVDPLDYVQP